MYQIIFGFLYLFSLLPLKVLYLLSDFAYLLIYHLAGYRKAVVLENLTYAFPLMKEEEKRKIAARFYRNFTDNWIETIKLISISKDSLNKRVTANFDVFDRLHETGKAAQLNLGHFFNWEIMTLHCGINQPYTFLTVYYPQSSQVMDRLMKYIRKRWGNPLLPSTEIARAIIPWRKKQYLIALGADQSTPFIDNAYWLYFLNRPAAFVKGPEKFARGQNLPVVMMTTTKPKRGHYHYEYYLLAEDPKSLPDGELIRRYVKHLEENIRIQPEIYLWSHRRWKHAWTGDHKNLWVDTIPAPEAAN
jgi:Kdo2-lipid IVA lauroyltransferase/acyltransferase